MAPRAVMVVKEGDGTKRTELNADLFSLLLLLFLLPWLLHLPPQRWRRREIFSLLLPVYGYPYWRLKEGRKRREREAGKKNCQLSNFYSPEPSGIFVNDFLMLSPPPPPPTCLVCSAPAMTKIKKKNILYTALQVCTVDIRLLVSKFWQLFSSWQTSCQ